MADQLQLRRGTTAQIATFTGAQGEVIVDTDKDTLVVQDGATAGGFPLASESAVVDGTFYFNDDVSGGSIANSYILSPKANTNIPTSYMDGQQYGFVTVNANTGPSTATFSALGIRSLKWPGGVDPVAGEISGRVYLIFDAANNWFEIQDIERSLDYLNSTRINVASAGTVDLTTAAPSTRHINITGTTTITAFTVAVGKTYFVRFAGALTLTNNAGIVTQSGANITTAAGDTCILRATAANVVEVMSYATFVNQAVGYGQTWQNVTGSRALGVTYTNSTGRPIFLSVNTFGGVNNNITISINGSAGIPMGADAVNSGNAAACGQMIVQAGATYTVSGVGLSGWWELR